MAAPGFAAAVEAARRLPKGISDGDRLRLYALFKQATVGEAPLANPASRLDVLSSMKWEAWDAVRGLSAAQAEIRYMELVRILTPTTAATPFHRKDTGNAAATQRTQPRLGPRVMVLLVCLFKMLQFIDRGVLGGAPSAFGAFIERTTGEVDSQSLLFAGISSVYSVGTLVGCSVAVAVLARGVAAYALLRAGVSIYILGVLGASMGFWMPDTPSSYYLFLGARAVVGFGAGCVTVTWPPFIEAVCPPRERSMAMSLVETGTAVGAAGGFIYSASVSASLGWGIAFLLLALAATAAIALPMLVCQGPQPYAEVVAAREAAAAASRRAAAAAAAQRSSSYPAPWFDFLSCTMRKVEPPADGGEAALVSPSHRVAYNTGRGSARGGAGGGGRGGGRGGGSGGRGGALTSLVQMLSPFTTAPFTALFVGLLLSTSGSLAMQVGKRAWSCVGMWRRGRGDAWGRRHAWACVGMRGHAWACVGMRGHAWACVGMRGHAWACVGMRGHAWARVVACTRVGRTAGMHMYRSPSRPSLPCMHADLPPHGC